MVTSKSDAIKFAGQLAFRMKTLKPETRGAVDEFIMYFENAVNSSTPFIDNVSQMRAQGIWLPDNISSSSVNKAYYNVAKGYLVKIANENGRAMSCKGFSDAFSQLKGFVDDIISGKVTIE